MQDPAALDLLQGLMEPAPSTAVESDPVSEQQGTCSVALQENVNAISQGAPIALSLLNRSSAARQGPREAVPLSFGAPITMTTSGAVRPAQHSASVPSVPLHCRDGHELRRNVRRTMMRCSECPVVIQPNETFSICFPCQYRLCHSCAMTGWRQPIQIKEMPKKKAWWQTCLNCCCGCLDCCYGGDD